MAKKTTGSKRRVARRSAGSPRTKRSRLRRILLSVLAFLAVAATIFFLMMRSSGQISIFENAAGSLITPVQNAFR